MSKERGGREGRGEGREGEGRGGGEELTSSSGCSRIGAEV